MHPSILPLASIQTNTESETLKHQKPRIKFPKNQLKESFELARKLRDNSKVSFTHTKQKELIVRQNERDYLVKNSQEIRDAVKKPVNYKMSCLRPLSRDKNFVNNIKEFEKYRNQKFINVFENEFVDKEIKVKSDIYESVLEKLVLPPIQREYSFNPRPLMTPAFKFREWDVGFPHGIQQNHEDPNTEIFNNACRLLVKLGKKVSEIQKITVNDSKNFTTRVIKTEELIIEERIQTPLEAEIVKISPVIEWSRNFDKLLASTAISLDSLLLKREIMCLNAVSSTLKYGTILRMVNSDLDKNLKDGRYVPGWNNLLPHIWLENAKEEMKIARLKNIANDLALPIEEGKKVVEAVEVKFAEPVSLISNLGADVEIDIQKQVQFQYDGFL